MASSNVNTGIEPTDVIDQLKRGNERYRNNESIKRNKQNEIHKTKDAQEPLAIVLSCIDSRVNSEVIFDQGIGDLFNICLIGNVLNSDALAGMEYACIHSTAKLVLVMGHTNCGAIKGACDYVDSGYLSPSLSKIYASIHKVPVTFGKRSSENLTFVNEAARIHTLDIVKAIRYRSPALRNMEQNGEIEIAAAMYDVSNGKVTFLDSGSEDSEEEIY